MITLLSVIVALGAIWALIFIGVPLFAWTLLVGVAFAGSVYTGALGIAGPVLLGLLFVGLAFFTLVPLRRALLTKPAFGLFKSVLPEMSSTEREVLEAGDVWWEAEMFRGRPEWSKLLDFKYTPLTAEEQGFLENECEELCSLVDDWKVEFELRDLPPEAWAYMREKRFFAMLIKKEHGGLGFSAHAQSAVVTKLATRSLALAVTVMVPNSLGPGELLMEYGTEEQKKKWLPGLASGRDIPCFGLTGPEVGSDATNMPDFGLVCYGEHEGKRTLGISLNFSKRWITLAPVATVVGLAFKLRDPEGLLGDKNKSEYGITCALVPASHPGVHIGRRHYPGCAFMNGPIFGKDVFIPIDWIIGGPQMAGHGWRMLAECLSAGRGISLPALSVAAAQASYRMLGAYVSIRRQFKLPIGKFEGVQEATGRIAGLTYTLEALRTLTASAVDHCAPSVVTAIAKYHMTEMMRKVVNDSMDVLGGRGIQQGPRNPIATAYKSVPIAITVEGANILTRNLMIYGQGAIRCHQFVFREMEAARQNNLREFDKLLFKHMGTTLNRGVRSFTFALTGARLASSPITGPMADYFRQLERMSAALAFCSDVTMLSMGGALKRAERLSARLGDVLSNLYIGSAVIKYFIENGQRDTDLPHARWALEVCLHEIGQAFEGFFENFPKRGAALFMKAFVFPFGNPYGPVHDSLNAEIANQMMKPGELRDRLSWLVYLSGDPEQPLDRMEKTFEVLQRAEPAYNKYFRAMSAQELVGPDTAERVRIAVERGLLTPEEGALVEEYDRLRYEVILTDDFLKEYLAGDFAAGEKQPEYTGALTRVA
jgi:acyl-CoA dehydrogenase